MLLSGKGESIAGLAMSTECTGSKPPYQVKGSIYLTMDSTHIAAGKKVYVNSLNTTPAPSSVDPKSVPTFAEGSGPGPKQDLGLYYYAGGQNTGYGAVGLGLERAVKLSRSISLDLDGGITGIGSVSDERSDIFNADQLIKSANGRVRFDLASGVGVYTGYRWNQGRGDDDHWQHLSGRLNGKSFVATSDQDAGTVQSQGVEYGLALKPARGVTLLTGYIPRYRTDFGGIGVLTEAAYTAELRFGLRNRMIRLRGLRSDDYWIADMGITLR